MIITVLLRVKRRRRTPLQADGACEAPPHKDGTKPKLNKYYFFKL